MLLSAGIRGKVSEGLASTFGTHVLPSLPNSHEVVRLHEVGY